MSDFRFLRNTFSFTLIALTLSIFVLPSTAEVAEQTLEEATSEPVTFPTADEWKGKDFRQAVAYITNLSKEHPLELPRVDGEDGHFKKLKSELQSIVDTLDMTQLENWKEKYQGESQTHLYFTTEILSPVFAAYSVSKDEYNIVYEHEVLLLLPLMINDIGLNVKAFRLITEEDIQKDSKSWPEGFADSLSGLSKVTGRTANAMISVLIRPGQSYPEIRTAILSDCDESLGHLLWLMSEADRELANWKLEALKNMTEEPSDLAVLDKLLKTDRIPVNDDLLAPNQQLKPEDLPPLKAF